MEESETLNKILAAANEEFSQKGFSSASLRTIVKKAGVTTGALYGYFKSKEELFDALVKEHVDYIHGIYDSILSEFESIPFADQVKFMEDFSSKGLKLMFDYAWSHKQAFNLILHCSGGTRYENFVSDIAKKDIDSTEYFYGVLEKQDIEATKINPVIQKIITEGTFASFFVLLFEAGTKEEADECLSQMFSFYRSGWNDIMHFAD
ncbi:MAG: TetR/AcrR family transcriptional regulator [Treponemataceae bacterium]|nr:TetR/AcrR family transcriptional regulator [Treponemataceae bacterium]